MTWFWGEGEIAENNLRQASPCSVLGSMRDAVNLSLVATF